MAASCVAVPLSATADALHKDRQWCTQLPTCAIPKRRPTATHEHQRIPAICLLCSLCGIPHRLLQATCCLAPHLGLRCLWRLEVIEDQHKHKQVVDAQRLLQQVSCKVLLRLLAALHIPAGRKTTGCRTAQFHTHSTRVTGILQSTPAPSCCPPLTCRHAARLQDSTASDRQHHIAGKAAGPAQYSCAAALSSTCVQTKSHKACRLPDETGAQLDSIHGATSCSVAPEQHPLHE